MTCLKGLKIFRRLSWQNKEGYGQNMSYNEDFVRELNTVMRHGQRRENPMQAKLKINKLYYKKQLNNLYIPFPSITDAMKKISKMLGIVVPGLNIS